MKRSLFILRSRNWPSTAYALSKPMDSSRFPRTSPIPARSVTGFWPMGSATKFLCFWEVVALLEGAVYSISMCKWFVPNNLTASTYKTIHPPRGGTTWTGNLKCREVNWILTKKVNWIRFFWDSHWLEIWKKHLCPSMGSNGGNVAMYSGSVMCVMGVFNNGGVLCIHLVIEQPQTAASDVVRQGRRYGPSITYKITPCWVTLRKRARRPAAVLDQPSSLRPHFIDPFFRTYRQRRPSSTRHWIFLGRQNGGSLLIIGKQWTVLLKLATKVIVPRRLYFPALQ